MIKIEKWMKRVRSADGSRRRQLLKRVKLIINKLIIFIFHQDFCSLAVRLIRATDHHEKQRTTLRLSN